MGNRTKIGLVLALLLLTARAQAEEKSILVVSGDTLPKVKVWQLLRITASAAAGRSEITATADGSAKILSTTRIATYVDGHPMIGADTKEYEIQATKKGKGRIRISIKDVIDKKTETKDYKLEVE